MKKRLFFLATFLLTLLYGVTFAQERTVSGTVTGEGGDSLPGATVQIKGTTTGVVTDLDGKFKLSVPDADGTMLVISFVGMDNKEVEVGNQSIIDVVMSDAVELSEVVITALGFIEKRDNLGGSSVKIDAAAVAKSGEVGLIDGMAGRAAGVQIVKSSGDVGAGSYIQIRGQSSLSGGVQPLIVVDGVPIFNSSIGGGTAGVVQQSRMNDISSDDIENIEILKGASASALWGSRAANGVILITTKQGKAGKMKVTFRSTYSSDQINKNHPLQNTFGQGFNGNYSPTTGFSWGDKISERSGGADVVDQSSTYFLGDQTGTKYYPIVQKNDQTIFQDENFNKVFQTGSFWENSVAVSGGNDKATVYASISNLDQSGIIRNSDYSRTTLRANSTMKFGKKAALKTKFMYAKTKSNRIQRGSNLGGLFLGLLRNPADFDISDYRGTYYPNGDSGDAIPLRQRSYRRYLGNSSSAIYNNPLWTIYEQKNLTDVDRLLGSVELSVNPMEGLTLIARTGIDSYTDKRLTYFPPGTGGEGGGQVTQTVLRETQLQNFFFAKYDKDLTDDITFSVIVGLDFNSRSYNAVAVTATNLILNDPERIYLNTDNTTAEGRSASGNITQNIFTSGAFAQVNLGFQDMIYLNLTGRQEVSSTYNGSIFFPSADVAFKFTELEALKNNAILSFGKLRIAYGQVGIQPGRAYSTRNYYTGANASDGGWGGALNADFFGGSFIISSGKGNPNLQAEVKTEFEVGTDLRFMGDKIRLSATYYKNQNDNALMDARLAPSTGFTTEYRNVGKLENKGFELEFGMDLYSSNDFKASLNANINANRNKVLDLNGTESLFLAGFTGSSSRIVEGQPIAVLWGGKWDRGEGGDLILDGRGFPQPAAAEGILGDPNPDWRGGLGATFSYKDLSLSFLFETFQGADMWNGTRGVLNFFGRSAESANETTISAADAASTITYNGGSVAANYAPNNDGTYTFRGNLQDFGAGNVALDQSWYTSTGGGFGPVGEQFVDDASWTRLRNVTLSYSLNTEAFRNATKLSSVEFSLTGRNLWLSTDWVGIDPETNLTGVTAGRGLEYFGNPNTKSFLFSIKINY